MNNCNVTVIIPTYQRLSQLLQSLEKILECNPKPDEIIIHIDSNDNETDRGLRDYLDNSKIQEIKREIKIITIKNSFHVGPGGGRNIAIEQAKNSIVASFDDDSYPLDRDYFQRLINIFADFPEAAVVSAKIFHINEEITPSTSSARWVSDFVGCGCAYRQEVFKQTAGYVSLPVAYGMEEVDLSLRLHDLGWKILESSNLRVFHNTQLEHHNNPKITAASIANLMLLTYLRYPVVLWWLGIAQCMNRIIWLVKYGRTSGILAGIFTIPNLIQHHYHLRHAISYKSLISYLHLRKNPICIQ
ncbi:MAG: glycosyltransferase family 2 protein [Nostocales cyanobacterium]|nr:MAG: glycosyltransferase family 2 protein [Nostocales cyanobacterium]TAF14771.1 MAG: glycosyltransferase family 2 protein [Nostocales cyanobacterium]